MYQNARCRLWMFLFMFREAVKLRFVSYELKHASRSPEIRHFAQYQFATACQQSHNVPKHFLLLKDTLVLVFQYQWSYALRVRGCLNWSTPFQATQHQLTTTGPQLQERLKAVFKQQYTCMSQLQPLASQPQLHGSIVSSQLHGVSQLQYNYAASLVSY